MSEHARYPTALGVSDVDTISLLGHDLSNDLGDHRVARDEGGYGPHLALFEAIGRVAPEVLGKALPLNGAGVCGAALADLGFPVEIIRGVVLLARCAGLVGQLADELRRPIAREIFDDVERHASYERPS